MKVSIITTGVAMMLSIMIWQASCGSKMTCTDITNGICENYIQLSYQKKDKCIREKESECLKKGFNQTRSEEGNRGDLSTTATVSESCFNQWATFTECIYIDFVCHLITYDTYVTYCIM